MWFRQKNETEPTEEVLIQSKDEQLVEKNNPKAKLLNKEIQTDPFEESIHQSYTKDHQNQVEAFGSVISPSFAPMARNSGDSLTNIVIYVNNESNPPSELRFQAKDIKIAIDGGLLASKCAENNSVSAINDPHEFRYESISSGGKSSKDRQYGFEEVISISSPQQVTYKESIPKRLEEFEVEETKNRFRSRNSSNLATRRVVTKIGAKPPSIPYQSKTPQSYPVKGNTSSGNAKPPAKQQIGNSKSKQKKTPGSENFKDEKIFKILTHQECVDKKHKSGYGSGHCHREEPEQISDVTDSNKAEG